MEARELRIGNWVNNNEEDYQITSATIAHLERGDSTVIPILLNEIWLKKFGFIEIFYNDEFFGWIKDGVNISKYYNFVLMLPNGDYYDSKKILYVHEIQNLYYSLKGVELLII